ncbi:MAG: hypothetical protein JNJ59_16310 [Deltaproteobacteria bacterium]|nr:hypothetical protein [Deltaproteobacteria bacterium]
MKEAAQSPETTQQKDLRELEHVERLAKMRAWLEDTAPLEQLRRRMKPGSTLDDARRLHRLLAQEGRRFSKVMRDLTDELA